MDKFQRIFTAIDFSSGSDEALRQAHDLAVSAGAKLAACYVVPNELLSHPLFHRISHLDELKVGSDLEQAAASVSARVKDVTGRTKEQFDLVVDEGTPYAAILTHAEKWLAALVRSK